MVINKGDVISYEVEDGKESIGIVLTTNCRKVFDLDTATECDIEFSAINDVVDPLTAIMMLARKLVKLSNKIK